MSDEFNFREHLARQRAFSEKTFGPGARTKGVLDHISREIVEVEQKPYDIEEWIDIAILALDGAWRAGASPDKIIEVLVAKQTKNEGRVWPDWRTAPPDQAIQHSKSDAVPEFCQCNDGCCSHCYTGETKKIQEPDPSESELRKARGHVQDVANELETFVRMVSRHNIEGSLPNDALLQLARQLRAAEQLIGNTLTKPEPPKIDPKLQPDASGWIPWGGGERPVGNHVIVHARLRDGAKGRAPAGDWYWQHRDDALQRSRDIIAYKVIAEEKPGT